MVLESPLMPAAACRLMKRDRERGAHGEGGRQDDVEYDATGAGKRPPEVRPRVVWLEPAPALRALAFGGGREVCITLFAVHVAPHCGCAAPVVGLVDGPIATGGAGIRPRV